MSARSEKTDVARLPMVDEGMRRPLSGRFRTNDMISAVMHQEAFDGPSRILNTEGQ